MRTSSEMTLIFLHYFEFAFKGMDETREDIRLDIVQAV